MAVSNFPFNDDDAIASKTAAGEIPYWVDLKTLKGAFSYDGQSFSCTVYTGFDPYKFVRAMLGTQAAETDGGGLLQLTRTVPELLPFPSDVEGEQPLFWCTSCSLSGTWMNGVVGDARDPAWLKPQPDPAQNQWPKAEWAAFDCTFTAVPADILTDDELDDLEVDGDGYRKEWLRNCLLDDEPHSELENTPVGQVVYEAGDGTAVYLNQPWTRRTGYIRRALTWMSVPQLPPQATFTDLALKVNDAEFMGFAAGTVLFVTRRVRPKTNVIGERSWDIRYEFLIRDDKTWNQVRDKNNVLRPLRVLVSGTPAHPVYRSDPPFLTANLGKLFRFE